jgi:hypothetical protein
MEIVGSEPLRHNEFNAVTSSIDKVETADGRTLVRKRLGRVKPGSPEHWQASDDPHHWNYWRREADACTSDELRASLAGTGLEMPAATIEEDDDGITLWLDFVPGVPGTDFDLADHQALARGLGRWQAQGPLDVPWGSRGFLRAYSGSKPAPFPLLDDDAAWALPIIRDCFPGMLRDGWRRLVANRERLLSIMESLPRTRGHLDVWAGNTTRRVGGPVALFDWSFTGDAALGEDIGNQVPDGVFDLFWPAERVGELDEAVFEAYLDGLRQRGWGGDPRVVRLGMAAASVKYAWLLPQMLEEASDPVGRAYWREVDPTLKYAARGKGMVRMVNWADEAIRLADQLGR